MILAQNNLKQQSPRDTAPLNVFVICLQFHRDCFLEAFPSNLTLSAFNWNTMDKSGRDLLNK